MTDVVVIGGGQAAASCVARLRRDGFDGRITLIGDEPVPPYQRPPLSKAYLLGEMELERLFLRPESFYADQDVDLLLNTRVTALDRQQRTVHCADGTALPYDKLVLATGSRVRTLPEAIGGDLNKVFGVRTLADVDGMAPEFQAGRRVVIVGGGYIGLEAAAVAAKLGLHVTLIEAAERILQRVASPETSSFFRDLHKSHGVDIREGVGLERLAGDGVFERAVLTDGSEIAADFAIVGIGILPNDDLAAAAGLEIENGIAVDGQCRTSDGDVYAIGDCCSFPHENNRLRLESVPNAIDMGEHAAAVIMGSDAAYRAKPWFWSDQYDVTLQIAGLNTGYDQVIARPGSREGGTSFWYFGAGRLLAVDAANDPRAYMMGKRWIEAGQSPSAADIGDFSKELKGMAVS